MRTAAGSVNLAADFETERMRRTIDATSRPEDLRRIAHMLLSAWSTQKAAVTQLMEKGWLPK